MRSGLCIRPRNQVAVITMEAPIIPETKKAGQVRSNVKVMLIVFFDSSGVIHYKYVPQSTTITKDYEEILRRLRDAVRRKRPDLWVASNWYDHHDNAPAHSSHFIQTFLAKHSTPVLHHTLPIWLHVISGFSSQAENILKSIRFQSREDIMRWTSCA